MARSRGGPRGSPANHYLFLEGGTWIFRWARRSGRSEEHGLPQVGGDAGADDPR